MPSTSISDTHSTVDVLGTRVDLQHRRDIDVWLRRQLSNGTSCAHVVTLNPEYVMTARKDEAFAHALRQSGLVTIDGSGVSVAVRLLGQGSTFERVTGVDLTWMLAEISAATGAGLFLLGASPGVADKAAVELQRASPGVEISGTWAEGSPREEHDAETIRLIADSGADAVLVAYGAPGQIFWIARNLAALSDAGVKIVIGIGGALDYVSGHVPWAPPLVRKLGLEWLYRLLREPWRWRRQLALPVFAALVMKEAILAKVRNRTSRVA